MELSEAAAVERVLGGDSEAFRLLVDRHSRRLFRLAYRMTGNQQDADDVVQETFLRAYKQLGHFASRSSFGTWLHRIAVNCALDLMKSRQRREQETQVPLESETVTVPPTQYETAEGSQVRSAVDRALDHLTANERVAFVLRHYEGRSIEEIGATLGTRVNATKNTIFRAVQKIRQELAPMERSLS